MLVTAVLPFCDFRKLADASFSRLPRPEWPTPTVGHVRGIGGVRLRLLRGFDSWVGEGSLVCGLPAMAIDLPRWARNAHFQLVRKACYFDNIVNGRIEFLVRVDPEPANYADAAAIARFLLDRPVRLRRNPELASEQLRRMGHAAADLWARATVKRGSEPLMKWVRVRNPIVVIETEASLGSVGANSPAGVRLSIEGDGKPFELFTIHPGADLPTGRASSFRFSARTLRTYLMRMLQDVEALSQICARPELQLDDNRVQEVFNEYTHHIIRSRAKIQNSTELTAYCYAAFAGLFPGGVEGLRTKVLGSSMRPNVRSKLLELLDEVEQALPAIQEIVQNIGKVELVQNKYGDVKVENSQGTVIGDGTATVTDSVNQVGNPELVSALRDFAAKVRAAENEDAAIEAEMIESAASKAEKGDEKGAVALLKKVGSWALGIGTTVGTAALTGFLKANGIG